MTKAVRVLKFSAEWCGPCKRIGPAVENLCGVNGVDVEAFDIDQSPEVADAYGVLSVPTFVALNVLGEEVWRGSGAPAVRELATLLSQK